MTTASDSARNRLLGLLTLLLSTGFCLLVAESVLGWYGNRINNSSQMESGLMHYHPQLGWLLTVNWEGKHQHHDFDVSYSTNSSGFRNAGAVARSGQPTVALIGDSFTFGFGVNDPQTFSALLNEQDPQRRYLNLGVPGYSTDQQYLMIQGKAVGRVQRLQPDHYILLFYLGNDLLDNALPYPLQAGRAKPYFKLLAGDRLSLQNTPVPKQGKPATLATQTLSTVIFGDELRSYQGAMDPWIRSSQILQRIIPIRPGADQATVNAILEKRLAAQERLLKNLLEAIQQTATQQNRQLTLALLPGRSYIATPKTYSAYFQDYIRRRVVTMGESLDIAVLDIATELRQQYQPGNQWFHPHEGHLTADGHQQVSNVLLSYLDSVQSSNKLSTIKSGEDKAMGSP